ncbi:MarR family winged helix-turn-helix transcriptional regulator [Calidifontibacter terrae]
MTISREVAGEVATDLVHVVKRISAVKHVAPRFSPTLDHAVYPALITLKEGPQRVSTIAHCIHSDVSTVSRQISQLSADGMVEKIADPDDGRAQMVQLTAEGKEALEAVREARTDWFLNLLSGWNTAEAAEFSRHLKRFGESLNHELERNTSSRKEEQ